MQKLLFVGLGGFVGACLRYSISLGAQKWWGVEFPYGTMIVNVAGGLLIGLLMELSIGSDLIPPHLRLFLVTGLLGGFTTFSSFSYETVSLLSDGSYLLGTANIALNLVLSLGGVVAGRSITQWIL